MGGLSDFLGNCLSVVSKRILFLMVFSWLFFGSVLVGASLVQFRYGVPSVLPMGYGLFVPEKADWYIVLLEIFFWNLVVNGFVLLSLSGLLFFGLPILFLLWRALILGTLLAGLSSPLFFVTTVTLVFQGEAYVLACVEGASLGLSWLKPTWVYKGEDLSRFESLKKTLSDGVRIYVFVALFLFFAAVLETLAVVLMF